MKTTKATHTPTPWHLNKGSNGFCDTWQVICQSSLRAKTIADCGAIENKVFINSTDNYSHTELDLENKANAAHIVKCVNLHDELVQALGIFCDEIRIGRTDINNVFAKKFNDLLNRAKGE